METIIIQRLPDIIGWLFLLLTIKIVQAIVCKYDPIR